MPSMGWDHWELRDCLVDMVPPPTTRQVPVTREIMRKWSAAMKRLRPKEHSANVTERDEVGPIFVCFRTK